MRMNGEKSETIGHQIFWLVTKTTMFAVLVVSITNVVFHVFATRDSKVRNTHAIAEVIARNSTAALSFDEPEIATELLESLSSRPSITDAIIVDSNGELFASFSQDPETPTLLPIDFTPGGSFQGNQLEIRVPINEFDQTIGTLIIHSSTTDIRQGVIRFIAISSIMSILVLAVGIWLASRMQKSISRPIMELAQTSKEISHGIAGKGDYSFRVENKFTGEIGVLCHHFNEMLEQIEHANISLHDAHHELLGSNEVLEDRVQTRTGELARANEQLQEEVDEKKRANQELKDLQAQLIESSRQAGMAEIANGVLHNVGNVLNSVNVSSTLIGEKISEMRTGSLQKASDLLNEHESHLGDYFNTDSRAKHFPKFLTNIVEHFRSVQEATAAEVHSLNKNIGFIKDVIQAQQSFSGHCGVIMTIMTDEIFDDALKFVSSSFERHGIKVEKLYDLRIEIEVDKSKLLQILTNFIKNAREAVSDLEDGTSLVRLSIYRSNQGMIAFRVSDNGVGISEEQIARVFTHGFTTKRQGHGFGLHSAAIAAKEMKGSINVESDGLGQGSTFTVEIPFPVTETKIPFVGDAVSPRLSGISYVPTSHPGHPTS